MIKKGKGMNGNNNMQGYKVKTNRMIAVFVILAILGISGCGLMPKFEYKQAKAMIPTIREYALNQITDLTEQERTLIIKTEPVIGHANYVIYYFWWKDETGKDILCAESLSPSSGIGPTEAYRCQDKHNQLP